MTVRRYADEFQYLGSDETKRWAFLYNRVARLLAPFIDFNARDDAREVERCATQNLPTTASHDGLAYRTTYKVTRHICSDLQQASGDKDTSIVDGSRWLLNSIDWIYWRHWK